MAHAVVMRVKLPQDGNSEEAQKMLHEVVVPLAQAQAGFTGGTWMHDGDGNGTGVVVFATLEEAETAKKVLTPPPGGPQLISSEVYEVGAQA
jgi:hypothetical protein